MKKIFTEYLPNLHCDRYLRSACTELIISTIAQPQYFDCSTLYKETGVSERENNLPRFKEPVSGRPRIHSSLSADVILKSRCFLKNNLLNKKYFLNIRLEHESVSVFSIRFLISASLFKTHYFSN